MPFFLVLYKSPPHCDKYSYTALNYSPTYKDHHFWVLPISDVMAVGGIPNSVKSVEDIEVGYYSNSKIDLVDKDTGTKKSTFYM